MASGKHKTVTVYDVEGRVTPSQLSEKFDANLRSPPTDHCSMFRKRRAVCSASKMRAHNQFYVEQIALRDVLRIDKDRENAA